MSTTQTLPPASYTGTSGGLKKSTIWLASEDIGIDVEKTVEVADVELHKNVTFDAGRIEPKVPALRFTGVEKHMILNSTNRKMMVRLFGMDTKDWRGKRVALYVDPDVKMAGQRVNGLRIRPAQEVQSRPLDELTAAGAAVAESGMPALKAWWVKLAATERELLGGNTGELLAKWKIAADAQPEAQR